jgi:hypothetical protein
MWTGSRLRTGKLSVEFIYPIADSSLNSTLISHAGTIAHIGQFFYNETWNDQVFELYPYNTNTNERTYNDEDSILAEENADGNSAFVE